MFTQRYTYESYSVHRKMESCNERCLWTGESRISPSQQKMERSNMIEKSGSPVYTQVTGCYYVTSQSVVVLENLGPIGSTKYIVEQKGDLPVYEVTTEGQKGKSRILHRNLLLPCDFLQSDLPKRGPQCTRERKRSACANQGSEFD